MPKVIHTAHDCRIGPVPAGLGNATKSVFVYLVPLTAAESRKLESSCGELAQHSTRPPQNSSLRSLLLIPLHNAKFSFALGRSKSSCCPISSKQPFTSAHAHTCCHWLSWKPINPSWLRHVWPKQLFLLLVELGILIRILAKEEAVKSNLSIQHRQSESWESDTAHNIRTEWATLCIGHFIRLVNLPYTTFHTNTIVHWNMNILTMM